MRVTLGKTLATACLLAALAPLAVFAQDADKDKDKEKKGKEEIAWAKTFAKAKELAKQDRKLIMVDVYTDWCGWCKKLDADTYPAPEVVKVARDLVSVKLDAEDKGEGQEFAETYKVRGFPTILFLDPAGLDGPDHGVVGKIGGYMPPAPFAKEVQTIATNFKEFPKLQERLKESPDDVDTLAKLAVAYHQRGDDKKAAAMLEKAEKNDPKNADGKLARAYNAVADGYQEAGKFDKAIPLFQKAADTGKDPEAVVYARMSMAVCHLQQGEAAEAVPILEAALKTEGISDGDKAQVKQILDAAREMVERSKPKKNDKSKDKDGAKP